MTSNTSNTSNSLDSKQTEQYSAGYGAELIDTFKMRTAFKEAAFFYPNLKQGTCLLDCGCGPGTITAGLAEIVAPGHVVAIDIEESQIEIAKTFAEKRGVTNIEFRVSSIYELPFDDSYFDAVFAHAVLQHLKYPEKALKEIYRALKPNGIVGVRDDDRDTIIIAPPNKKVERLIELLGKHMKHNGGNPYIGKHLRELLRKAGFTNTRGSASCEYHGVIEETTKCADLGARLAESIMAATALEQGWVESKTELNEIARACVDWGKHPDAFDAIIMCEAVGIKPGAK